MYSPPSRLYNLGMIGLLQSYHAFEILLTLAGILILIDYFFPTDWPAHLGYLCAGASAFFAMFRTGPNVVWDLPKAAALGIGVWILLEILHRLFFWRFLTNAPGSEGETITSEPVAE